MEDDRLARIIEIDNRIRALQAGILELTQKAAVATGMAQEERLAQQIEDSETQLQTLKDLRATLVDKAET
jgi:hypothetical protein